MGVPIWRCGDGGLKGREGIPFQGVPIHKVCRLSLAVSGWVLRCCCCLLLSSVYSQRQKPPLLV